MNKFKKLIFFIKRPPLILVVGEGQAFAKEAILKVLSLVREKFSMGIIFESDLAEKKEIEKFSFFLKKSKFPILVVTHFGKSLPDMDSLKVKELAKILPARGFLILNFDEEILREIKNETRAHCLTYGFQQGTDLKGTDINTSPEGTNFKIDYQGKIVPFWLKKSFDKEQIYNTLAAIAVGIAKEINLVEISQALRN